MFAAVLLLVSNAYFQFTILRHEWLNMGTPPTQIPKIDLDEPILTPVVRFMSFPKFSIDILIYYTVTMFTYFLYSCLELIFHALMPSISYWPWL